MDAISNFAARYVRLREEEMSIDEYLALYEPGGLTVARENSTRERLKSAQSKLVSMLSDAVGEEQRKLKTLLSDDEPKRGNS